jgi:hypothetical protein
MANASGALHCRCKLIGLIEAADALSRFPTIIPAAALTLERRVEADRIISRMPWISLLLRMHLLLCPLSLPWRDCYSTDLALISVADRVRVESFLNKIPSGRSCFRLVSCVLLLCSSRATVQPIR